MLSLPVTLTIAAGAAFVNIWLMIRCGQARTKESVSIGDGGNEFVIRRMRAHANFVESAPFILILIAAREIRATNRPWKQNIAYNRQTAGLMMENDMSGRVAGAVNDIKRQIADGYSVAVDQPAVRLKTMRLHAITRAVIVELIDPETVVLMRAFNLQAQFLRQNPRLPAMVKMAVRHQ